MRLKFFFAANILFFVAVMPFVVYFTYLRFTEKVASEGQTLFQTSWQLLMNHPQAAIVLLGLLVGWMAFNVYERLTDK